MIYIIYIIHTYTCVEMHVCVCVCVCVGIAIDLQPFHYLNDKLQTRQYIVFYFRASYTSRKIRICKINVVCPLLSII